MTVILEPETSQAETIASSLPGATTCVSVADLDRHVRDTPHERVVVIGPSVALHDATTFAEWSRIHRPALGVILLRQRVESAVLSQALRSGMREVVDARDLTGVAEAAHRAHAVAAAMLESHGDVEELPTGRLLTVFSTKGGVGKSLVATNMAVALADLGRKVCLVDLDVDNGDVAIMLQLTPAHQLNDLAAFGGVIDEGAAASLLTEHSPGLSVVAAPVHVDSPDRATPDAVGLLLERLKSMFDLVVVDTSGAFDDFALCALDVTDILLLVGTLDIPALKGLKLAAGTLDLLNFPREKWRFVLNRADSKVGLSEKEFQDTLGIVADCRLTTSRDVLAAVNRGEALVRVNPGHPNSKALTGLAAGLLADEPSHEVARAGAGRRRSTQPARRLRVGRAR